jgi:hypothetical protein
VGKLFLHIGIPKSGTTAIQNQLWSNRSMLSEQGVTMLESFSAPNARGLYVFAESSRTDRPAHVELGISTPEALVEFRRTCEAALCQELGEGASDRYFLSSEGLWTLGWRDIASLQQKLATHFAEVEIVVYLRRQDRKVVSNYSTQLRGLKRRAKKLNFAKEQPENYLTKVSSWALAFGRDNVTVRVYERAADRPGSVVEDMLEVMGVSAEGFEFQPIKSNPPITALTQEVLRTFNALARDDEDLLGDVDFKKWIMVSSERAAKDAKPYIPERELAERFYAAARESNNELARIFLDEEQLFDEDFDFYPETATQYPGPDEIGAHALRMLRLAYEATSR